MADRRVLVVDDDRDFAESLAEIIEGKGYQVRVASSEEEAIRIIRSFDAQIALLDICLHNCNGLELIPLLKRCRPEICCIMMTGYASLETAVDALHQGAYDYLSKPTPETKLFRSLDHCFEKMHLQRENRRSLRSLHDSESLNSAIMETTLDSIISINHEGKILAINSSTETIFGYRRSEMIGREMADLIIPPALQKRHRRGLERFITSGKASILGKRIEINAMRSDGSIFPVELSIAQVSADGPPIFSSHIRDISERKQTERTMLKNNERLHRALEGTILAVASMLENRDPYTASHQSGVTKLACAIGAELGLDESRLWCVRMGAAIHDIGKIQIPAEILTKPSKLSDLEYTMMKAHPEIGYSILKDIEFPWAVAEIARQHHERMDGTGYPRGLCGQQILLEARIVSVADVVEAMATHRPYRPSLGIELALSEISNNRGTLYDEDSVDACLTLFNNRSYSIN